MAHLGCVLLIVVAVWAEEEGMSMMQVKMKGLDVGVDAPDFEVKDGNNVTVRLSDYRGKKVVLFFYPKDDTPGCTKLAQNFRDHYGEFLDKDVAVLGISMDGVASHRAFIEKYGLPFQLLADVNGDIKRKYRVEGSGYARFCTYIIDEKGKVMSSMSEINRRTHAA